MCTISCLDNLYMFIMHVYVVTLTCLILMLIQYFVQVCALLLFILRTCWVTSDNPGFAHPDIVSIVDFLHGIQKGVPVAVSTMRVVSPVQTQLAQLYICNLLPLYFFFHDRETPPVILYMYLYPRVRTSFVYDETLLLCVRSYYLCSCIYCHVLDMSIFSVLLLLFFIHSNFRGYTFRLYYICLDHIIYCFCPLTVFGLG